MLLLQDIVVTISGKNQHVECCAGAQRLLRLSLPSVFWTKSIGMHDKDDDTTLGRQATFSVKAYTIKAYLDSYTNHSDAIQVAPMALLGVLLPHNQYDFWQYD